MIFRFLDETMMVTRIDSIDGFCKIGTKYMDVFINGTNSILVFSREDTRDKTYEGLVEMLTNNDDKQKST